MEEDVWLECNRKIQKCSSSDTNFPLLLGNLLGKIEERGMQLFAVVARHIWFQSNYVVYRGEMTPLAIVIQKARIQIQEYEQAQKVPGQENNRSFSTRLAKQWKKPSKDFVKLIWMHLLIRREARWGW